ncbi:hypothetical protein NIES4074_17210 [Cylindrospermum sp. NIES-4074]|nr:hypothetical protein NIES4074_17210 [Cylindrospermum sp. NIES-4074]
MASIKLSELQVAGSELFQDSESFINDLSDATSLSINGGDANFQDYGDFGVKYLEYLILGYGVDAIKYIVKSFSDVNY